MISTIVNALQKSAFLFYNKFINKYMYFIPLCEYDTVEIDDAFDSDSYAIVKKDDETIFHIKDLRGKELLTGDENLLIIPEYFDFDELEYFEVCPESV